MSLYSHEDSSRECLLPPNAAAAPPGSHATTMGDSDELETAQPGNAATDTQPPVPEVEAVDAATARRIVRKIDRRLLPLLFVTYVLNFMDKTILSSASVFGLKQDTHLEGQDYAWVSSVFYFGYFAWAYPTTLLVARLPVGRYLAANTLCWGAVVALTAACVNYGGLLTVRFLLGVAEATVSPALMFVTSTWYTRDEVPTRTGIWFAGNSVGGIASSFLAFGIGHIRQEGADNGDAAGGPWRWLFLVLGAATWLWGFVLLGRLPDGIARAAFLTPAERRWAQARVVAAGTGTGRTARAAWRGEQAREGLADPQAWLVTALCLLCQIPNGGTQNFAHLVLVSFGFTGLQSTLVNVPYSLLTAAAVAGTGWLAGRFRSLNCVLAALVVLPPVAGSALIGKRGELPHGVALLGYFLLSTGPAALPLLLSLVQVNFRGVTKKGTVTALVFVAYCAGNVAGPQLFRAAEAPGYATAFRAIMVCYALVVCLSLGLRCYLQRTNKRREREEGIWAGPGASGVAGRRGEGGKPVEEVAGGSAAEGAEAVGQVRLRPEDYEDVTDWKTVGFRYRL